MAFDHPDAVKKLATLDVIPTYTMFASANKAFGMGTYHWFFLAQPFDLPERLIGCASEYYMRNTLSRWSGNLDAFAPEALQEYIDCFSDPACIHATCEDYRAGATIDCDHDAADLGKNKIACPMLALWGAGRGRGGGQDRLAVWREWAADVRGRGIDCGHFLPEEAPDETFAALRGFFAG
jgi:haloacetate dehalogenase